MILSEILTEKNEWKMSKKNEVKQYIIVYIIWFWVKFWLRKMSENSNIIVYIV